MSTAGEEHHPRHSAGQVFMALVAGALALIAAYLWLTDGAAPVPLPAALAPAEPAAAPVSAPPVVAGPAAAPVSAPPVVAGPVDPPVVQAEASHPLQPPARTLTPSPTLAPPTVAPPPPRFAPVQDDPPQAAPIDPQVAADAAAVGMTARVRPADPAQPGQ
jgi:hypothetical protein